VVNESRYYQCSQGPDQWLDQAPINKESELGIQLTNPLYSTLQPHKQHYRIMGHDHVGITSGTKKLTQFRGSNVVIVYTTRKNSYGRFMWMPLPKLPLSQRDLALITIEQKRAIDNRFTEEECLMEPQQFREIVMEMTIQNGFDSFVRLLNLSCKKSYFRKRCMIFVVSIVSDIEMDKLRKRKSSISIDVNQEKVFEISNENIQNPHIARTVVFRGHFFSTNCHIGMDEIALVMAAHATSFQRTRTTNLDTFHMIQERQSNMASRSMGVCGNASEHHYFNDECTNNSLVPLTSPSMNMIFHVTEQVQDSSGQVLIRAPLGARAYP
jgi:hypothetical protein